MSNVSECPTCERPVGDDELDAQAAIVANSGVVAFNEEEEIPTELDVLEDRIERLEAEQEVSWNLWRQDTIEKLKKFALTAFDSEGAQTALIPETENVIHQFSPDEALDLDGWWTVGPGEFGKKLSRRLTKEIDAYRKRGVDILGDGLELSRRRSNGCWVIRNKQETANEFLRDPQFYANKYGTSLRVIQMMGYRLDGWKYMLPTFDYYGATKRKDGQGHFAIDPEVPFNDAEIHNYRYGFSNGNFGGGVLAGAKWTTNSIFTNPEAKAKDRISVTSGVNRHRLFIVPNHPHWVIPQMQLLWNTSSFKYKLWRTVCFNIADIDRGAKPPQPGYLTRAEMGGDVRGFRELNGENTSSASKTQPKFDAGSELNSDGSQK